MHIFIPSRKVGGTNLSNQNENIHNSYDSPIRSTILFKFIIIVDLKHLHKYVLIKKILHTLEDH